MAGAVYLCGGETNPGPRDGCPNVLHDWPLPSGYVDAHEEAASRLYRRWKNVRCADCGLYGWRPGEIRGEVRCPAPTEPECWCSDVAQSYGLTDPGCPRHDPASAEPEEKP